MAHRRAEGWQPSWWGLPADWPHKYPPTGLDTADVRQLIPSLPPQPWPPVWQGLRGWEPSQATGSGMSTSIGLPQIIDHIIWCRLKLLWNPLFLIITSAGTPECKVGWFRPFWHMVYQASPDKDWDIELRTMKDFLILVGNISCSGFDLGEVGTQTIDICVASARKWKLYPVEHHRSQTFRLLQGRVTSGMI